MRECDRHRTFAYRGRASLHGSMPHISSRENAGHVRFQVKRTAVERPVQWSPSVRGQVRPSDKVPGVIAHDAHLFRPFGMRDAA